MYVIISLTLIIKITAQIQQPIFSQVMKEY